MPATHSKKLGQGASTKASVFTSEDGSWLKTLWDNCQLVNSPCKIAKTLHLTPSTVNNIVRRFRETREISVWVVQGWKPLLNVRDLQTLRGHCMRNCHASRINIATWAQQYFRKPLSLHTVHCSIKKLNLKLHYAMRKPYNNSMQKRHRVPWAWAHLRWTERKWKRVLFSDLPMFQIVFGKHRHGVLRAKDEMDPPDC